MKSFAKISIPVFIIFILSSESFAQTKFEREYGIQRSEVPIQAANFVDSCNFTGKIKWYAEESQEGKTFEAKTKHLNYSYSIEFDTNGILLDIEKEVKFDALEESVKDTIKKNFADLFKSYKVKKVQVQWTGERVVLLELLINGHTVQSYTTRYEIVVKASKNGLSRYYEVLLDASGDPVEVLEIKQQSADNLVF